MYVLYWQNNMIWNMHLQYSLYSLISMHSLHILTFRQTKFIWKMHMQYILHLNILHILHCQSKVQWIY